MALGIMSFTPEYLHLAPFADPPALDFSPSRVVVVLDVEAELNWQKKVSSWLISIGCLYMMAWGPGCSSWDDSVDFANAEGFGLDDIPEDQDAMTTWHENEPLSEVMWFAKNCAIHPIVELVRTLLLHIGPAEKKTELLATYDDA